jgi:hypothetical protein
MPAERSVRHDRLGRTWWQFVDELDALRQDPAEWRQALIEDAAVALAEKFAKLADRRQGPGRHPAEERILGAVDALDQGAGCRLASVRQRARLPTAEFDEAVAVLLREGALIESWQQPPRGPPVRVVRRPQQESNANEHTDPSI